MSYEVLARKWRPQSFADLVGQTHVVKALTYALSHQQIHHAYLFTGTRGVGKTSIARIFAKSLNCEVNGVSATPCGQCTTCQEITAGKFVDLIEVDAASRTGVEETRELIDSVAYLPSKGRYKVYLIDEVHMFSKSSFNALLKTLEEPPEHVKFILATTDPEKLPITILSRCLQFNLKSLTPAQIKQHLANICSASDIIYDEDALQLLAKAGDGSMRDTLSMTDQAIAYGHGELRLSAVTEILGTIQPNDIEAILFAIATNNPNQLSQALHRLDDYEVDARAFLIEVMRRLQRMAWAKEGIVDQLSPKLQSTVNDIPKELLHLWYDIAEKALPNLAIAGEPRQAVEMALLRMLAFIPADWVTRHRTLLETPETNSAPETTMVAEAAQPAPAPQESETTAPVQPVETPPAAAFAEHIQASPVIEHDSLDAAEAEFSGQSLSQESLLETKQTVAEPVLTETPIVVATPEPAPQVEAPLPVTQTATTPSIEATPAQEIPEPPTETNWQLSTDNTDQSPPPSMDDVRALMQSGRDIPTPAKAEIAEPVVEMVLSEAAPTTQAEQNDTPPWEDASIDDEATNPPVDETVTESVVTTPKTPTKTPSEPTEQAVPEVTPSKTVVKPQPTANSIESFDWYETLPALGLTDYTNHLASLGIMHVVMADGYVQATLDIAPKHELLITEESLQELSHTLENHFSIPTNVATHLTTIDTLTPSERDKIASDKQQSDLLNTFRQEPITQQVLSIFDGQIIEKTVKPRSDNNE